MDLINYSVKDFVLNESFQKWILERDERVRAFWEDWMNAHPHKTDLISEARATILFIREANESDLTHERDQVWNMINASIGELEKGAVTKIGKIESNNMKL